MRDQRLEAGDRVIYAPESVEAEVLEAVDVPCGGCLVAGQQTALYLPGTHWRGCRIQQLNSFQLLKLRLSNGLVIYDVPDRHVKRIL